MSCGCHRAEHETTSGQRPVGRRMVLAGGLAAGLTQFLPGGSGIAGAAAARVLGGSDTGSTRDYGFLPPRPAAEVHQQNIMFPVLEDPTLGRASWTDTYLAPRGGGRLHEGQDLMGNKMLKLLACVDGTIVELRYGSSGNSLYLRGTDGYYYCYLHINNDRPGTDDGSNLFENAFAPGMAVGKTVRRGDHLAYVGDSGNAESSGSHCHFEIRLPNANWYNAAACNAKYSLDAAETASLRSAVPPEAFSPLANAPSFAVQQGEDFLGRFPGWPWLISAMRDLQDGTIGLDAFIERQLARTEIIHEVNPMIRLYQAYFGGIPTAIGVSYWVRRLRAGQTIERASAEIAGSRRFTTTYDVADDRDFVAVFFENLYGYKPSPASIDLRIRRLRAGMSRGAVVRYDCESRGYRSPSANRTRVISVYHAMLRRSPTQPELDLWVASDRSDPTGMERLIEAHRTSPEYAARFS